MVLIVKPIIMIMTETPTCSQCGKSADCWLICSLHGRASDVFDGGVSKQGQAELPDGHCAEAPSRRLSCLTQPSCHIPRLY